MQRKRRVPIPFRLLTALATLIGVGTGLLLLPGMTTQRISVMDALFTSTSASAVTGLTVVATSTAFTRLGQWVILLLMQLGGVGFVVATVLTLRLLGRRISLVDRLAVAARWGWPRLRPFCRSWGVQWSSCWRSRVQVRSSCGSIGAPVVSCQTVMPRSMPSSMPWRPSATPGLTCLVACRSIRKAFRPTRLRC